MNDMYLIEEIKYDKIDQIILNLKRDLKFLEKNYYNKRNRK